MIAATMPPATKPRKSTKAAQEPAGETKPTLAEIGKSASHEAQRRALLAELRRQRWILTATARELGLSSPSNVLRAIKALGLDEEYEAARAAGKISPGNRIVTE